MTEQHDNTNLFSAQSTREELHPDNENKSTDLSSNLIDNNITDYRSLFNALYDNSISMLFTLNLENKIVSVNNFGLENLGYKPGELEGQFFINIIHTEDQNQVLEQLELCKKHPSQIFQWEFKMIRRDSSIIRVKDNTRTIEVSEPTKILVSCEDITVRKNAELGLIEWKNRYESAVNVTDQILYDYDLSTDKVTFGGNVENLFGISPGDVFDFNYLIELVHPEDREFFDKNINIIKNEKKQLRFVHRIKTTKDEYIFVDNNASILESENNKNTKNNGVYNRYYR